MRFKFTITITYKLYQRTVSGNICMPIKKSQPSLLAVTKQVMRMVEKDPELRTDGQHISIKIRPLKS